MWWQDEEQKQMKQLHGLVEWKEIRQSLSLFFVTYQYLGAKWKGGRTSHVEKKEDFNLSWDLKGE